MEESFHILSMPREDRIEEYKSMLPDRISKHASPRLLDLLLAEVILENFVPSEWKGMNFDPFELSFLDSLTDNFLT